MKSLFDVQALGGRTRTANLKSMRAEIIRPRAVDEGAHSPSDEKTVQA